MKKQMLMLALLVGGISQVHTEEYIEIVEPLTGRTAMRMVCGLIKTVSGQQFTFGSILVSRHDYRHINHLYNKVDLYVNRDCHANSVAVENCKKLTKQELKAAVVYVYLDCDDPESMDSEVAVNRINDLISGLAGGQVTSGKGGANVVGFLPPKRHE